MSRGSIERKKKTYLPSDPTLGDTDPGCHCTPHVTWTSSRPVGLEEPRKDHYNIEGEHQMPRSEETRFASLLVPLDRNELLKLAVRRAPLEELKKD